MNILRLIGNILWFIFFGWWLGLGWLFFGLLWCITIIGIPVGIQCFKLSGMGFFPFGKEIKRENIGAGRILLNVLWFIFGGLELAIAYFIAGIVCCITIVGIPFGLQCFKLMNLALFPFGAKSVKKN
jgi:uncharacterized membrane protein YccF (DUF307 family)